MEDVRRGLPPAMDLQDKLPFSLAAFECPFCTFWKEEDTELEDLEDRQHPVPISKLKSKSKPSAPYPCLACMVSNDIELYKYLGPVSRAINELVEQHKIEMFNRSRWTTSRWTTRAKRKAQDKIERGEKHQQALFEQRRETLHRVLTTTRLRYYQDIVALCEIQMDCQHQSFQLNQRRILEHHELMNKQQLVSQYSISISRPREQLECIWMTNEDWNSATVVMGKCRCVLFRRSHG